jgi:hypothetical protein
LSALSDAKIEPQGALEKRATPGIPSLPPPSAEVLEMVKQFWVEGVMKQSVQHEALIDLGKETKADAVEHPWEQVLELPDAAGKPLPADTRVTDVFEEVGRLLLILGEPGSGKTMTLLELARDLARQSSDPGQAVPVVFNLSSWTEKFKSLADWLTEELNTKYRIPKRINGNAVGRRAIGEWINTTVLGKFMVMSQPWSADAYANMPVTFRRSAPRFWLCSILDPANAFSISAAATGC